MGVCLTVSLLTHITLLLLSLSLLDHFISIFLSILKILLDDRETRRTPEAKPDSKHYSQNVCKHGDHEASFSAFTEKDNIKWKLEPEFKLRGPPL